MLYVRLWLIAQLLLLLPNRRTVSLHCRDGSIRYQRMRVLASISLFPRLFSRAFFPARSRFILILQQRFTPTDILLIIVVLYL